MDQDSTNGAGGDKPNWRERLGMGPKDMPKISDEFKSQPLATPAAKPETRAPQPVTRLAPMAPRPSGPPPVVVPQAHESRRGSEAQSESLAEKLRAQRAAAEMLAVQRVSAARQRAEARSAAGWPNDAAPTDANAPASRPKFSFAEDNQPGARRESGLDSEKGGNGARRTVSRPPSLTSLIPPRPALGGERSQSSLPRQSPPSYRPDVPSGFRPIDPATGYVAPSSRSGLRGFPQDQGFAQGNRTLTRKPAYESYRRGQENTPYGNEIRGEDWRSGPRLGRSLAGRSPEYAAEDEFDDVFEDEAPPPRRRAGASDYHSAYREAEEGHNDGQRRPNGPWLLLMALLVAAFATGGVIWFYNSKAVTTASTGDTVPVVEAPDQPAKTAAEKSTGTASEVAAVGRKQIYDRIVGDREVTGDTVVPTEVTPIEPETLQLDQSGIPQPTGSNEQDQGQGEEEAVPLPPAPEQNTEGKADQSTDQNVVAAAGQSAVEVVKTKTAAQGEDNIASLLPATGTDNETSATSDSGSAASSATLKPATLKPETQSPPVEKKATAASKKKPAADDTASLGAEPVVIVPPGEVTAPSQEGVGTGTLSQADATPKQPPAARKRTLFDLFSGNKKSTGAPSQDTAAAKETATVEAAPKPQTTETKVAALPKETETKQSGGSGYVVQLASFRSQEEAQTEYARLSSKYPSVIGKLPSNITQATVAGSTRHRLGLGPLATRDQASQICSSLFAAGERDCLVRKQ